MYSTLEKDAEVYTPKEIARMLRISERSAYMLCERTTDFKVLRIGRSVRIIKASFDEWLKAV